MKKAFSLSFSTIAVVVALLAVLLMVVIFFSRGFGTTEARVANIMDKPVSGITGESKTGGTLDISNWLPSLAKKWCSGACVTKANCCPEGKTAGCACDCKAAWKCVKTGCSINNKYYTSEAECKSACNSVCSTNACSGPTTWCFGS